jgi:transposase-like protein
MPHIHWVARQNKLEIPRDKDEVKQREIRESDGQAHDPDTMVAPLTPKPTRKAETLARAPPTIASRREEDAALKEVAILPRYRCASCIPETKTNVGSTAAKAPAPRTTPKVNEAPTAPKQHTQPSHECDGQARDPEATAAPPTPKPTRKAEALARAPPTIASRREEDAALKEVAILPRYRCASCIPETKTNVGSTAAKAPAPRTTPKVNEAPTAPKPPSKPSHPQTPRPSTPSSSFGFTSSSILPFLI